MADTYKTCQPFLPLSSTVLFGRFALAKCPHRTPQKIGVKLGGYPYANYCIRITNQYRLHPVSQRYPPVFFQAFYDIFENLIEFIIFDIKFSQIQLAMSRFSPKRPTFAPPWALSESGCASSHLFRAVMISSSWVLTEISGRFVLVSQGKAIST